MCAASTVSTLYRSIESSIDGESGHERVMGRLVMIRKVDFVRRMAVAAVRHLNDGLELMWFRNLGRGFEVFTFCVKVESLARIVGSHCFNSYDRARGHGTRLLVLVMEKESEARRHVG